MNLIKVNKPISLNPIVHQESYIPITEIIASVYRNTDNIVYDNPAAFCYYDIENRECFWNWQTLFEETPEKFVNKIEKLLDVEFLEVKNRSYNYAKINPFQIKIIQCLDSITKIIPFGKNIEFFHDSLIDDIMASLDKNIAKEAWCFSQVNRLIDGECYINNKRIKNIQVEDYISITPDEIEFYLNENGYGDNAKLFYIIFDDNVSITVAGESIEDVCRQIWGEVKII